MAKLNGGLFSKLKGKVGGVVFQQYEGLNVSKEYQPNVKNPNTKAQVISRAKFKLASQKVAVYADVLLVAAGKVSQYVRNVRGALVNALYRVMGWDDSESRATLLSSNFDAAVNGLNLNPSIAAPVFAGTTIANATVRADEGDIIRYTITALDSGGTLIGSATKTINAGEQPIAIQAPLTSETPSSYEVVAVAYRPQTENGVPTYSNIIDMSAVEVGYGVNAGDILISHISSASFAQS